MKTRWKVLLGLVAVAAVFGVVPVLAKLHGDWPAVSGVIFGIVALPLFFWFLVSDARETSAPIEARWQAIAASQGWSYTAGLVTRASSPVLQDARDGLTFSIRMQSTGRGVLSTVATVAIPGAPATKFAVTDRESLAGAMSQLLEGVPTCGTGDADFDRGFGIYTDAPALTPVIMTRETQRNITALRADWWGLSAYRGEVTNGVRGVLTEEPRILALLQPALAVASAVGRAGVSST